MRAARALFVWRACRAFASDFADLCSQFQQSVAQKFKALRDLAHRPYGEFGVTNAQTPATGRTEWFKAHADEIKKRGWGASAWNDGQGHLIDCSVATE